MQDCFHPVIYLEDDHRIEKHCPLNFLQVTSFDCFEEFVVLLLCLIAMVDHAIVGRIVQLLPFLDHRELL